VRRVLPHVPNGCTFVDVGANVGLFTEALLRHRPDCTAILFEPVERYHAACAARVGGLPNVTLHRCALSDSDEERTIFKAKHNYGANSVLPEIMFDRRENSMVRPDTVVEQETIICRTWDGFAAEHGIDVVDFVKTDTEGFDFAVLRGMLGFLERTPRLPVILSELLEEDYHPRWPEQLEVVERLVEVGYRPVDLTKMAKVDDILFLPGERATGS
jgi:FkbM family methyltransferase